MAQQNNGVAVPGYLKLSKVVTWFLYFYILIGIISLVFHIFLLLFSANQTAGFYQFIGRVSAQYLEPFRGIFPPQPAGQTGYLDVSALFAILVYLLVLWAIHSLINYVQNKIDLSVAVQKKQLEELKRQQQYTAQRQTKVTVTKTATRV